MILSLSNQLLSSKHHASISKLQSSVQLCTELYSVAVPQAIQDHSLEWRQFDLAKNNFLLYINKLNWPEKHQHALTMFFMNIVAHPYQHT
jgi:hypothetical protein